MSLIRLGRTWASVLFVVSVCLPPLRAVESVEGVRKQAAQFEKEGQWAKACELYAVLLSKDRGRAEIRSRYHSCLRRVNQMRRHADATYQQLLNRDIPLALRIYTEVVTQLRTQYVDHDKADPAKLFQQGREDLHAALETPAFRAAYVPDVPGPRIRAFLDELARDGTFARVQTIREAREKVLEVALAGYKALGLKPTITILEFACGACNGLDEQTLFLPPSQLREIEVSLAGTYAGSGVELSIPEEPLMLDARAGIGYVQIANFQKNTPEEVAKAVLKLQMQGMNVLIVDLRGNAGGLFDAAVQVAEHFLPEGTIVSTRGAAAPGNRTYTAHNPHAATAPLVVLIDAETASAAEIVAGAWKENRRATLVGQTSFGKGSMQSVLRLTTAPAGVRVTWAKFFSPSGHPYAIHGVIPHILVERSSMSFDEAQLQAAVQVARQMVMGSRQ